MESRYNTEQSNIVIMFYRNICVALVLGMLFMIGMGRREKLIPNELVKPLKNAMTKAANATKAVTKATAATTGAAITT
jgi:hypothetical protein